MKDIRSAVDMYNETGKVFCGKCGMDLVEREGHTKVCSYPMECQGIVITKETLKAWAKEQGKELIT